MIDGLIAGRLFGAPTQRTGQSGKTFVTAKVRAAMSDGEALFANVIAFAEVAKGALLALGDGDSVAVAGTLTPGVYTGKDGVAKPSLDVVAHQVLTTYAVNRKREAVKGALAGNRTRAAVQGVVDHAPDWADTPPPGWDR